MEWVETTGRTVDEAKERALDLLGVEEADAEFEELAQPRAGLFGRMRTEARIRARVKPTAPRAKDDRRDRRRRSGANRADGEAGATAANGTDSGAERGAETPSVAARSQDAAGETAATSRPAGSSSAGSAAGAATARTSGGPRRNRSRSRGGPGAGGRDRSGPTEGSTDNGSREEADVEVAIEEQGSIAEEFLTQLTGEFGLKASVAVTQPDEETVELQLSGHDLGLLIGPKGSTLLAIQNLTRTYVHHRTGANNGHINVDVGGYRHKRSEALTRFAEQVAESVKQSGARTALEPMSSVDRKVVHDTISKIDGVDTVSEGEDPHRRVVVMPAPNES